MQTIRITIGVIIIMLLTVHLQGQVELCSGETLIFELDSSSYYGKPQLEYSPDGLSWEFLDLNLGIVIEARVEESGFYRVSLLDSECDTVYYSQVQKVVVPSGNPKFVQLGSPKGVSFLYGDSIHLDIGEFDLLSDVELIINGQVYEPVSSYWKSAYPGEDVWVLVRAYNDQGCIIQSDTLFIRFVSQYIEVNGFVLDSAGYPIMGARVSSAFGGDWVLTNEIGYFEHDSVGARDNLGSIIVEKNGYFSGSRTFIPIEGGNNVRVRLIDRKIAGTVHGKEGGQISYRGVEMRFEAGSFERNGQPYNGSVLVALKYLDPLSDGFFEEMPGDLQGLQGQDTVMMLSYGMIAAELTDMQGRLVTLVSGRPALVDFPLSETLLAQADSIIDLWFYDSGKGLWVHDGTAVLIDNFYRAHLSHFSLWNCDKPMIRSKIKGRVIDSIGVPVPNASIRVKSPTLGFANTVTNKEGVYYGWVPSDVLLDLQVRRFCFPGAGGEQLLYEGRVGPFMDGTHMVEDIIMENCEGAAEVCGWVLDDEDNVLIDAVVEIREAGEFTRVTVDSQGEFCILVPVNRTFELAIYRKCVNPGCGQLMEVFTQQIGSMSKDSILRDSFQVTNCVPELLITKVVDVLNPATGKIWMDRNLGASRVALSSIDTEAYGDLYQWGRNSDGHQCRNSQLSTTLSISDQPEHGNFILATNNPYDWRNPQNTDLWQGVNGINNPCPLGYRIPTEAELEAEHRRWSGKNASGAFKSPLKFVTAGERVGSNGNLSGTWGTGAYWTSTVSGKSSRCLRFHVGDFSSYWYDVYRSFGSSVRCIKD